MKKIFRVPSTIHPHHEKNMKRFVGSLLIASLIFSPAFAAEDEMISGAASLHHLAKVLGIEVPLEQVENILTQEAERERVVDTLMLINAAEEFGLELLEQHLTYTGLHTLGMPVITSFKAAFDDENPITTNDSVASHFIVVEQATEKWVRIFGISQNSARGAATVVPRDRFLELWTGQTLRPLYSLFGKAAQRLAHIKIGTAAYNAKLKSGVIEFSITLSEASDKPLPAGAVAYVENGHQYEKTGYWYITYRFDGTHQFYDVKMRKKMELNGAPLSNWHESHFQYRMDSRTLYFREKSGTEWQQQPIVHKKRPVFAKNIPSDVFEAQFNPRWWGWPPWGFKLENLIRIFKPINVQQVNVEGVPYYLVTLQRAESDSTRTLEIWLDPQKAYQPTRILLHRRSVQQMVARRPDGKPKPFPLQPAKVYNLTRYTYQLAQFKPDIWFPKIVTIENSFTMGQENKRPPRTLRKTTMRVQRAAFNVPISEKDLGIISDK